MSGSIRIPLAKEEVNVGTDQKITGRVHVKTETRSIEQLATAELVDSEVEVRRVAVDRFVEAAPDVRVEDDVTIIPVLEEVLVVEKKLVLKEELHVVRRQIRETVEVPVTLRKQEAVVERDNVSTEDIRGDTDGNL